MSENMRALATRVPEDVKEWVRRRAFTERRSETSLIVEMLREGIERRDGGYGNGVRREAGATRFDQGRESVPLSSSSPHPSTTTSSENRR
jgi:hypothetical protein